MTQKTANPNQKPEHPHPAPAEDVTKQKKKAAQNEVAGRHKNDGRNDHAGHKLAP